MSSTIYRQSKIGEKLVDALDELIQDEKITAPLALRILEEFDQSMFEALQEKVSAKTSFKGRLDNYRFCDNVWTFVVSNAAFKTNVTGQGSTNSAPEVTSDKVKIVCVDARLLQKE